MSHIHDLMKAENEEFNDPTRNVDPIQYYFQNQAKIQHTYKNQSGGAVASQKPGKQKQKKKSRAACKKTSDDDVGTVVGKLLKELVSKIAVEIEGAVREGKHLFFSSRMNLIDYWSYLDF